MTAITASHARTHFAELLNLVRYGKERIMIEKHNRPVAALVSVEEVALLDDLLVAAAQDDRFRERIEALLARQPRKDLVDLFAHPTDETILTPEEFNQLLDRTRYPRPATQALRDLMAADSD